MCQLISIIRRTTSFKKFWGPTQNSRRQKGHMKRVPHRGPTNIRRHDTKFGLAGELEPGKSRIPVYTSVIPVENSIGNPIQTFASFILPFFLQHPFPSLHLRAFSYSLAPFLLRLYVRQSVMAVRQKSLCTADPDIKYGVLMV